jgi:hypothetical protein
VNLWSFGPIGPDAVVADAACLNNPVEVLAADTPTPHQLMGLVLTEETFADLNRPPMQSAEAALAAAEDLNQALAPTAAGPTNKDCP